MPWPEIDVGTAVSLPGDHLEGGARSRRLRRADILHVLMSELARSLKSALKSGSHKLRRKLLPFSDYDRTIPPEIVDDEFYEVIRSLARSAPVRTVLEIGSSTGAGSTRAFVEGLEKNPTRPLLLCMELSLPRYKELVKRYAQNPQVKCYNLTSVPLSRFPTEADVISFYRDRQSALNRIPLREVLRWLRQDIRYVDRLGPTQNGIQAIKRENGVDRFGIVLIDGSEFTGGAELDEVYGADFILLDDIGTFKNFGNYERLVADPSYELRASNRTLRNGYAVFELRAS
jgi:hypothetical protein